jgi:hypothetical protein
MRKAPSDRQCGGRGRRRWGRGAGDRSQNRPAGAGSKEEPQSSPAPCEDQPTSQPAAPVCPPPPPYHPMRPGFFGGPPPPGPPPHWAHLGPHSAPHLGPPPHVHWPHHRPHPPPFAPRSPHAPTRPTGEFDDALKEAIRRSLRDIAPKEAETAFGNTTAVPPSNDSSSEDSAKESDAASSPRDDIVSGGIVEAGCDEQQAALEDLPSEEPTGQELSAPQADAEKEDSHPEPKEHYPQSKLEEQDPQPEPGQELSAPQADAEDEDSYPEPTEHYPQSKLEEQDPQPEPEEQVVGTSDGSAEKSFSDPEIAMDSDKSLLLEPAPATPKSSVDARDESFASDAVGSGDVAEAMGATLDMVAGVISEMLSEADSHNRPSVADAQVGNPGELIVDPTQKSTGSPGQAPNEESEWHFVKPDDEEEASPDNEIGRAAEMLGSALFSSDMQSSAENVSTLSTSDSFSVPSTVPSITSGSRVAPAQRAQWSVQLWTLRELGFEEALCVETLERLKAANIGVGSDDDISVTQVVNAIMEQN